MVKEADEILYSEGVQHRTADMSAYANSEEGAEENALEAAQDGRSDCDLAEPVYECTMIKEDTHT